MGKRRGNDPLTKEEKRKLNKENLTKLSGIFVFVWPYKSTFIVGMVFLLLSSITSMSFPYISGQLIDAVNGEAEWELLNNINIVGLVLVSILFVQAIFSFFRVYLFARVNERSMADIRVALYKKYMLLPFAFYDNRRTGELTSRITSDVSVLQDTLSITLAELLRQMITLIVGITIIFYTASKLSLFMLATFPVLIGLAGLFGQFIRKYAKKTQDGLALANVVVEETLQAIQVVKAFTSEWFEINKYTSLQKNVVHIALKSATFRAFFISSVIFLLFGGIVGVMWYGALLVQSGDMTVGELLSFILYTTFIGGSMAGLGNLYGQVQRAIGASERILEILGENTENLNPTESIPLKGRIEYRQVRFSYPKRKNTQVIKGLSLEILPGQKVALIGHSGAGKSTLTQLLMRFYPLEEGSILVDGKDISNISLHAYRENIGIVPQEILLFGGSIRENIAYGKLNASHAEIIEASKKANAYEFISDFPEGFDTTVGERGVKLSGGQKQRVAIARAILKDPAILVLDEATSSLDAQSEYLVQEALEELMKGRTTIIIAHRLATIRKVDKIFVLKNGQIKEAGTHEELMLESHSTYKDLVKLQLQED